MRRPLAPAGKSRIPSKLSTTFRITGTKPFKAVQIGLDTADAASLVQPAETTCTGVRVMPYSDPLNPGAGLSVFLVGTPQQLDLCRLVWHPGRHRLIAALEGASGELTWFSSLQAVTAMGLGSRCAVALQKMGRPYQVTDDSSSNNSDIKHTYLKRNTTNKNDVLSQLQNYISKLITTLILYKTQVPSHPNQAFGFGHEGSGFQVLG